MLIRRALRRFATREEELAKLQQSLPKDQFYQHPDKQYIHPTMKVKSSLKENFADMKNQFGQDYKTPDEKYDLHVPRAGTPEGGKTQYERFHENNNFQQARNVMKFIGFLIVLGSVYIYRSVHKAMTREKLERENIREIEKVRRERNEQIEKLLKSRRQAIEELKREKGVLNK
ncbi:unnamed protein product [Blepharisma stoltei]|uniref:Uncharacterized protein n=1 Tax=Blepharisma stoltei TaxID=1481888 RepID=A0AAU9K9J9_9CILI|nr:unnamed protein product [Blepharisma stoltei]